MRTSRLEAFSDGVLAITITTNLLLAAVAYSLLQLVTFRVPGGAGLREALGRDLKGKLSPV